MRRAVRRRHRNQIMKDTPNIQRINRTVGIVKRVNPSTICCDREGAVVLGNVALDQEARCGIYIG